MSRTSLCARRRANSQAMMHASLASFPGPAQLFVACSTNSDGKLGGAWVRGQMNAAGNAKDQRRVAFILRNYVQQVVTKTCVPLATNTVRGK